MPGGEEARAHAGLGKLGPAVDWSVCHSRGCHFEPHLLERMVSASHVGGGREGAALAVVHDRRWKDNPLRAKGADRYRWRPDRGDWRWNVLLWRGYES